MTKNEIIRELANCHPCRVKRLDIIYHKASTNIRYVFHYEYISSACIDDRRELARVILSIYKLRKYVESVRVAYFSDESGECVYRFFDSCNRVNSVSDFIHAIKL